ncbi:MAG: hypothetical protein KatS3mg131_1834 [Candidatus Tectimicrobiota bacterium]|nr:MAG: hypothetical protein KatS3mg131_1834 [Candidatus Tectomicrobia bacterium]
MLLLLAAAAAAQENRECLACHARREKLSKLEKIDEESGERVSMLVDVARFRQSAHGTFPCLDCHLDLEGVHGMHAPELEPVDCVTSCHDRVAAEIARSQHLRFMRERQQRPPSCKDCHRGEHSRRDTPRAADPWHRRQSIALCSSCHEEWLASYRQTLHGQLAALGPVTTAVPTCADCHGYHEVVSPPHPASFLAPERLPQTCGRCHPGVAAPFFRYIAHPQWHNPSPYPLWTALQRASTAVLGLLLAALGLHSALWGWRLWRGE